MNGGSVRSHPPTWHILHEDYTDNRSNNRCRHRDNPDMQRILYVIYRTLVVNGAYGLSVRSHPPSLFLFLVFSLFRCL